MRIRNAETTDASKLSLLMNEGFGWENTKLFESSFFNNKNITCLVAENDQGEIMGSASLHLLQKINRRLGIIEDVVVFKKFRGKMVGVKLIKKLIEISKDSECYKLILNTNEDTVQYYEYFGFIKKQLQMELREK
tara:strand:+ start:949 stop:1353 length:405 start_codon:yes stop_codon:yes gene_type:complete